MTCTSWHGPRISAKSARRVILSNGSPKPRSSTISCAKRIVPASVCQKMPTPRDRRCSIQSIDSRATRPELGLAARIPSMTNPPVGRHQKLCRLQHWHSITACRPDFWIGLGHRTSLPILQPSTQFWRNGEKSILAIWALLAEPLGWGSETDCMRVGFDLTMPAISFAPREERLHFRTVPRGDNPNLHAQDGVFTLYVRPNDSLLSEVDRCPIEESFTQRPFDYLMEDSGACMYHFTLPKSEAGHLLWYLDKNGVNAAKLFPGFDGAARAVSEYRHHVQPSDT